jgi:hypothetical protein
MTGKSLVAFALLMFNACGCSLTVISSADMDGKLQDYGLFSLFGRYVMYLGTVELTSDQERDFRIEGLPPGRNFNLSLDLSADDCEMQRSDLQISLRMTDENGHAVIDENLPLRELVWSTGMNPCTPAYGYVLGRSKEFHRDGGGVCFQPIITGADGGNGTYFVSRAGAVYLLTIRVSGNTADSRPARSLRAVLRDIGIHSASVHCP